jgi:hypothetical protein
MVAVHVNVPVEQQFDTFDYFPPSEGISEPIFSRSHGFHYWPAEYIFPLASESKTGFLVKTPKQGTVYVPKKPGVFRIEDVDRSALISELASQWTGRLALAGSDKLYWLVPDFIITNSLGTQRLIRGLVVRFSLNPSFFSLSDMRGYRIFYSKKERVQGYQHSHLKTRQDKFTPFCTGHAGTPWSVFLNTLQTTPLSPSNAAVISNQLLSFLSWESVEGAPYVLLNSLTAGGDAHTGDLPTPDSVFLDTASALLLTHPFHKYIQFSRHRSNLLLVSDILLPNALQERLVRETDAPSEYCVNYDLQRKTIVDLDDDVYSPISMNITDKLLLTVFPDLAAPHCYPDSVALMGSSGETSLRLSSHVKTLVIDTMNRKLAALQSKMYQSYINNVSILHQP